jgi:OFA family oxalate/formate antiporter-like MFS transporter
LVSTVSRWFVEKRGLALGIAVLGSGSGIFFVAPLAEYLIATSGWRMAYIWLGVLSGGLIVVAALFLARDPSERGLTPFGAAAGSIPLPKEASPQARVLDFVRTWLFWRMSLTFGLWWFAGAIVYVQIAPFLLEKGFDSTVTATFVAIFGASNCLGRVGFGSLSDRIGSVRTYQLALVSCAVASTGFGAAEAFYLVAIIAVLLGFGVGGVSAQLTSVSIDLFGTRAAGALMGTVLALMGILGAGGPLLSGTIYDAMQSYAPAFHGGAAVFVLALLVSFGLRNGRE